MTKMRSIAKIEITSQEIADLMITAIEGGSNYWCNAILLDRNTVPEGMVLEQPWYSTTGLYEIPGIAYEVVDDDEGEKATYRVTNEQLMHAMQILAERIPHQFSKWLDDRCGDAESADCWLQCAVFGEVIYG